jgi:methionyl aminopeptidase
MYTSAELKEKNLAMREGGLLVREIKKELAAFAQVGRSFLEIENKAQALIKKVGAVPNFALEPGYEWAICINKNEGMVHGIPNDYVIADGDLISIDMGILWKNYNLDTSISFVAGSTTPEKEHFLHAGQKALNKAIDAVIAGASVFDVSKAIEKTIINAGYHPSFQLTGHGVGAKLHEEPMIPNLANRGDKRKILYAGQTLAIEVMYAVGNPYVVLDADGWTYRTQDNSLSGLFEETVLVTERGAEILT